MHPLFPFAWVPGYIELIVIAVVALLLFGRRLPGLGRDLGTGIREFKDGLDGKPGKDASDGDTPAPGESNATKDSEPTDAAPKS